MNAGARPTRRLKRILVVDDDPDVRLLLTLMLGTAGYEVDTAEDAYEALLSLYDTHPDLLMLDLMLPEAEGWDVIEAGRSDPETRNVPIVAMSAMFRVVNAAGHGLQGYVPKPFDTLAMLDTLDEVLRRTAASGDR
jgi:DNA-binding response OmpR family regulator